MADDLRPVLGNAVRSYRTVRATIRHRLDRDVYETALRKFRSNPKIAVILDRLKRTHKDTDWHWRIHLRRPRWWRCEESFDGGLTWSLSGGNGDRYWQVLPSGERLQEEDRSLVRMEETHQGQRSTHGAAAYSDDMLPTHHFHPAAGELLDPNELLLEDLHIERMGEGWFLDRTVILARATLPQWERRPWPDAESFAPADDYELRIDEATGVVLRFACRIGGTEFSVTEMLDIDFDQELTDELFEPPPTPPRR